MIKKRNLHAPYAAADKTEYEGRPLTPHPDVVAITNRAIASANEQKNRKIGIHLETPFTLRGNPESAAGNLFMGALADTIDTDIVIENVQGGLRSNLPAGDLTFGSVYQMAPFDNGFVVLNLSGRELKRVIGTHSLRRNRLAGFAGMRATVSCNQDVMSVVLERQDGTTIADDDTVRVAVNDYLALGGINLLAPVMPEGGYPLNSNSPLTRDLFIAWLAERGGSISADQFLDDEPRWVGDFPMPENCRLPD